MRRLIVSRATVGACAFLIAAGCAGFAPLLRPRPVAEPTLAAFPGWPATVEGRSIRPMPISDREVAFSRDFPGRVGRFTDGEREIVLRWVAAPTRRLHPSPDCFRALGYKVSARPMRLAASGQPMTCFHASGHLDAFDVCEQMTSTTGQSWPDVSSWYWHALWSNRGTTWWSTVVATPVGKPAS